MSLIPNRNEWLFSEDNNRDNFNKEYIQALYVNRFLTLTNQMFKYENLPKSIPEKDLEFILQTSGSATFVNINGELYATYGNLGGIGNAYYHPTISVVSNPYLKYSATLTIGEDCEVVLNDCMYTGLLKEIQHYSNLLAECDVSFKFACVNIRVPSIVSATDSSSYESAKKFFEMVEKGEHIGVILDDDFKDKISVYDYAENSSSIVHLIELKQYIIGTFYNNLGIQSQFNMKREAINEAEALLSQDTLFPMTDEMLRMRREGIERVNKKFGTNISVDYSSIWKHLRDSREQAFELQESEIVANLNEGSNESGVDNASESE